jgi:transcriptional regulator with XRE-family HTH domain
MPAGRPTDYDPAFCDRVIILGKQGKSRAEMASALDCSRTTIAAWEAAHPEFLDATKRASDESLAWWENKARNGIDKGSQFNAQLWAKSIAGRLQLAHRRDLRPPRGGDRRPDQPAADQRPAGLVEVAARLGALAGVGVGPEGVCARCAT